MTNDNNSGQEHVIEMNAVHKWYGSFHVLKDVNLKVSKGERIVICGPSGSGKSTAIRCINHLEEHQKGQIIVDGTELTGDLKHIEKIRQEVGMVFQHFNLFPHLTILENLVLAPIWVKKMPKKEADLYAIAREPTASTATSQVLDPPRNVAPCQPRDSSPSAIRSSRNATMNIHIVTANSPAK